MLITRLARKWQNLLSKWLNHSPGRFRFQDLPKKSYRKHSKRNGNGLRRILLSGIAQLARVYGIASLAVLEEDENPADPLDMDKIASKSIYFNVLDPLNTAGSLVLDQDPNSLDFLKPTYIRVAGKQYHSSRTVVIMNEQPIYIEWTQSAFGFVGRSIYQRALYPLKSFVQTMVTDNTITEKAGLIVAKIKSPGSILDRVSQAFGVFKRNSIKGAKTGNVIQIGIDEAIESLDMTNLRDAAQFARDNIIKNIATSGDMPASFLNQETLAEGFGEGTEDAKSIARYLDTVRQDMTPLYDFMDRIVMARAWNKDFYASIQRKYPELYGDVEYSTAFYEWKNAFVTKWPNLLTEPDSEKIKVEDIILKAAIGVYEVMSPEMDPENKASLAGLI